MKNNEDNHLCPHWILWGLGGRVGGWGWVGGLDTLLEAVTVTDDEMSQYSLPVLKPQFADCCSRLDAGGVRLRQASRYLCCGV